MTTIHDTLRNTFIAEQQKLIEQQRAFIQQLFDERSKDNKPPHILNVPQVVPSAPWTGHVSCRDASNDNF